MTDQQLETAARKRAKMLELAQKKAGKDRAVFGDSPKLVHDAVPTDIPELDDILGYGGFKRGRIGAVIGEASMGKTLITQWIIKSFQARGLTCGFIDPEKTFDPAWFEATGVNVEDLIVVIPECTEQAFDIACEWAANKIDLIVIDSLAALVPRRRAENPLDDKDVMGLAPFKIGEGLAQLTNKNLDSLIICTNQLRSKLGVVYGSPDTIPGGRAQKFYYSYILHVRRADFIKEKEIKIGYNLKVTMEKNKTNQPFLECKIPFLYTGVIDTLAGLVDIALDLDIIQRPNEKGSTYIFEDEKYRGLAKLKAFLTDEPEAMERLKAAVIESDNVPEFGQEITLEDMGVEGEDAIPEERTEDDRD